jgi:prephenate dehydrogenase
MTEDSSLLRRAVVAGGYGDVGRMIAGVLRGTGGYVCVADPDTLSVKSRLCELLRSRGEDLEAVGLNPMFAPSLGLAGRPVAVVAERDGPRTRVQRANAKRQRRRAHHQRHPRDQPGGRPRIHPRQVPPNTPPAEIPR